MTDHHCEFPFEEIRMSTGDYWPTIDLATASGYDVDQIWSVVVTDHDDGYNTTYTYGPTGHLVNLMGYTVTNERHDRQTYYHEIVALQDENGYERFLDRDTKPTEEEMHAVFGQSIPFEAAMLMIRYALDPAKMRQMVNEHLDSLLKDEEDGE